MRVLTENLNYNIFNDLLTNLKKVSTTAVINDIPQIAKALNDFKPQLLILKEENINSVVKAYCDKNNVKIICFGSTYPENKDADITFQTHLDIPRANLDVLTFKEDIDKDDVSVFVNDEKQRFATDFLSKNYNVKIYGNIKIDNPRYLGMPTELEKYEILNRSKVSIVFNLKDAFDSILLDTYPIVAGPEGFEFTTFNNIISLIEQIDDILINNNLKAKVNYLKSKLISANSLTFTIDTLQQLRFKEQVFELNNILEDLNK